MYLFLSLLICTCRGGCYAQDLRGIVVHGLVSQGFLFSSNNNYLYMKSNDGSPQGIREVHGAIPLGAYKDFRHALERRLPVCWNENCRVLGWRSEFRGRQEHTQFATLCLFISNALDPLPELT
jgi:hypothetical protein